MVHTVHRTEDGGRQAGVVAGKARRRTPYKLKKRGPGCRRGMGGGWQEGFTVLTGLGIGR